MQKMITGAKSAALAGGLLPAFLSLFLAARALEAKPPENAYAVEGTAVIDAVRSTGSGVLLQADGRDLTITPEAGRLPNDKTDREPLSLAEVQPGDFLQYQGHWTDDGRVVIEAWTAWKNTMEPKEQEIYTRFEPTLVLPANKKAGPPVLKVYKNRYPVLADKDAQAYLDQLGTKLLPTFWRDSHEAERFGRHFWFMVVDHGEPQASAFPGGTVVVHSGLFSLVGNEAQLAFVLAHETAHAIQEHPWREYQYERGKLLFLRWATAGVGYVVESAIRRGYERELEAQADRLALRYMVDAGYDPREALNLLRTLEANQQGLSALWWESHMSYGDRRQALSEELLHYSQAGLDHDTLTCDTPRFREIRDRVLETQAKR